MVQLTDSSIRQQVEEVVVRQAKRHASGATLTSNTNNNTDRWAGRLFSSGGRRVKVRGPPDSCGGSGSAHVQSPKLHGAPPMMSIALRRNRGGCKGGRRHVIPAYSSFVGLPGAARSVPQRAAGAAHRGAGAGVRGRGRGRALVRRPQLAAADSQPTRGGARRRRPSGAVHDTICDITCDIIDIYDSPRRSASAPAVRCDVSDIYDMRYIR